MAKKRKRALAFILCILAALAVGVFTLPLLCGYSVTDIIDGTALRALAHGASNVTWVFSLKPAPIELDSWPSADPAYRLEARDGPLAAEDAAYYIATKLPDEYKNESLVISGFEQYAAVRLAAVSGADVLIQPPYDATLAAEECTALEIDISLDCGDAGYASAGAVSDELRRAASDFLDGFIADMTASSDYAFKSINVTVSLGGQSVAVRSRNDTKLVSQAEYYKYHPPADASP